MAKHQQVTFLLGVLVNTIMLSCGSLTDTINELGWKRIMIVSQNKMSIETLSLATHGIHVSLTDNACNKGPRNLQNLDGAMIDMEPFNETQLLRSIKCGRPEPFRTLIIMTRDTMHQVQETLRKRKQTIGVIGLLMPEYNLERIVKMAFNDKTIVMPHKHTLYNFQNLQLECVNLRYPPVIDYTCEEDACQVTGMYPRIISHLGRMYNFTIAYHQDPSRKWGSPSRLGENDTSVLKTLYSGHSAFSFSWIGTYQRVMKFDHILGISLKLEMYMMQSGPKVAMDMVFQPFSTIAWAYITVFVVFVALLNRLLKKCRSFLGEPERFKFALGLLLGLFMTVIISFYRSAMILALTAKQSPPFETLLDGLADPDWNLVYTKGSEGVYKPYYQLIDKEKRREFEVLHEDYQYKSGSRVEKYQHLTNPKTFLLEDGVRAANFLRNTGCQRCKDAFKFGRPETKNSGFLFEKHSPLRSVFKDGLVHMREIGAIDYIKHSLGPQYNPVPFQSALPLTIQLMVLLFMFLGSVAMVMCPILLAVEYLWRCFYRKLVSNKNVQPYQCERIYKERTCEHCGLKQIQQTICIN